MRYSFYVSCLILCVYASCKTSKFKNIDCKSEFAFTSDYLLTDKDILVKNIVTEQKGLNKLGSHPMIVLDAIPYIKCDKGSISYIPLAKSEISEISVLNGEKAIPLYGKQAKDGIILITSKAFEKANQ